MTGLSFTECIEQSTGIIVMSVGLHKKRKGSEHWEDRADDKREAGSEGTYTDSDWLSSALDSTVYGTGNVWPTHRNNWRYMTTVGAQIHTNALKALRAPLFLPFIWRQH